MEKHSLWLALLAASCSLNVQARPNADQGLTGQERFFGELRLFDFTREFNDGQPHWHDTSLGGLFGYRSGQWRGLSFGGTFASANPLNWHGGEIYGLVGNDSDNKNGERKAVNRAQEYFVRAERWDTALTLGAHQLSSPMMNTHEIRALPRSFRGAFVENQSLDGIKLQAHYVTDSIDFTRNGFIPVSQAVEEELAKRGVEVTVADNPVYAFGASYESGSLMSRAIQAKVDAWVYHMPDVLTQYYGKLTLTKSFGDTKGYFSPSWLRQQSSHTLGEEVLDTYQYGAHLGVERQGLNTALIYARTGEDAMFTPWGDSNVIQQQVYGTGRGNDNAYGVKLAYDLTRLGLQGLSATALYASYQSVDEQTDDFYELDLMLGYELSHWLQGASAKVRYAIAEFDEGFRVDDLRVQLYYKFTL